MSPAQAPVPGQRPDPILVVGVGEDGWDGLSPQATQAIEAADLVIGSPRQCELIAGHARATELWPTPMTPALAGLRERHIGQQLVVLASGDPMFYGVGASLAQLYGADAIKVLPAPSSVALACARLGWAQADVDVVSAVGRPLSSLAAVLQPGRRVLVLVGETQAATEIAELLDKYGLSASQLHTLERLGGPFETAQHAIAAQWNARDHDRLTVVAIECIADPSSKIAPIPLTPGLDDDIWLTDGVLTKREVRAITLAMLAPLPGQLMWDVGAGSGSVAVEWMRSHRRCRAIAIESRDDRRAYIAANRERFGVPSLQIVAGRAPQALIGLDQPDAIFIGGGATSEGVVAACLDALALGGRLIANGVTIETETALAIWQQRVGGTLSRIAISHAEPIGAFSGYRPALPVTQWTYQK